MSAPAPVPGSVPGPGASEGATHHGPGDGGGDRAEEPAHGAPPGEGARRRSFLRELPFVLLLGLGIVIFLKSFLVQAFFIPSGSMQQTLQCGDRVLVDKTAYLLGDVDRDDVVVFRDWTGEGDEGRSSSVFGWMLQSLREGVGLRPDGSETDLIKRVAGLPGDLLVMEDSRVTSVRTADGEDLVPEEPWVFVDGPDQFADFGPISVPEGQLFVLGDHRNNSQDSRLVPEGRFVDADDVVGRAFMRFWPPSRIGGLDTEQDPDFVDTC